MVLAFFLIFKVSKEGIVLCETTGDQDWVVEVNFKLFNASFEESLNLLDDNLVKYMINDVERPVVREKPVLLKFLAILFILLLYGMC